METLDKLELLGEGAKYDICASTAASGPKNCPKCSRKLVLKNVSVYCTVCRKWFCINDPRIDACSFQSKEILKEQLILIAEEKP